MCVSPCRRWSYPYRQCIVGKVCLSPSFSVSASLSLSLSRTLLESAAPFKRVVEHRNLLCSPNEPTRVSPVSRRSLIDVEHCGTCTEKTSPRSPTSPIFSRQKNRKDEITFTILCLSYVCTFVLLSNERMLKNVKS